MSSRHEIKYEDIMPMEQYSKEREDRRKKITKLKVGRRIAVGPDVTFYFESYETIWHQIHEMLHVEKGGNQQIVDELEAYNPLIPKGNELVATMMFEIDDPVRRDNTLRKLGGVEDSITIEIGDEIVRAVPESDIERTKADGKTSAVHFVHFNLSDEQIIAFKKEGTKIVLGFSHENYSHMVKLPDVTRNCLSKDLN